MICKLKTSSLERRSSSFGNNKINRPSFNHLSEMQNLFTPTCVLVSATFSVFNNKIHNFIRFAGILRLAFLPVSNEIQLLFWRSVFKLNFLLKPEQQPSLQEHLYFFWYGSFSFFLYSYQILFVHRKKNSSNNCLKNCDFSPLATLIGLKDLDFLDSIFPIHVHSSFFRSCTSLLSSDLCNSYR